MINYIFYIRKFVTKVYVMKYNNTQLTPYLLTHTWACLVEHNADILTEIEERHYKNFIHSLFLWLIIAICSHLVVVLPLTATLLGPNTAFFLSSLIVTCYKYYYRSDHVPPVRTRSTI